MDVAKHFHVLGVAVEIQGVAPNLLICRKAVHVPLEEKQLLITVVPSAACGKHIAVLPKIHVCNKFHPVLFAVIYQVAGLDKNGVREHIYLIAEGKELGGGVVGAFAAFNDLTVLVTHRATVTEHRNTVLCVVIEVSGTEQIVLLVAQLNDAATELGKVFVNQVIEFVACQNRFILNKLHVSPTVYDLCIDTPYRGITDEIGSIMQEGGVDGLAVTASELVVQLYALSLDESNERICRLLFLSRQTQCR